MATILLSTGYDSRMGQDGIDAAKDFGQFATGVLTEFSGSDKNFQKDFEDTQAQFGGTLLLMLQNLDSIKDDDSIMKTIQGGAGAKDIKMNVAQDVPVNNYSELDGNDPRTIPSNGLVYQGWSADGFHESISPQGAAVGAVSVESSSISVKSVEGQDGVNLSVISVNGEDFTSLSDARFNGSASAQTFEEVVQTMNNEFESTVAAWDTEFESTVKEEFSSFKM